MSKPPPGPWTRDHDEISRRDQESADKTELRSLMKIVYQLDINPDAIPLFKKITELCLQEWESPVEGVQRGELIARLTQYSHMARAAIRKAKER